MMFSLLKENKNFRLLWIGQLISALGDRLTQMGLLSYIMITSSDDGSQMAVITFFSLLPFLIFGPFFGALTDRRSRKAIMIFADVLRAVFVLLIPWIWINTHSLLWVTVFVFILGTFSALFSPAKMSIIPSLMKKDRLIEANSFMSTTGMIATLIGTLVAGILLNIFGVTAGFYLNGASYLVSAALIAGIVSRAQEERKEAKSEDRSGGVKGYRQILEDISLGRQYIRRHLWIARLIQLSSVFSFMSSFAYILVIHYATHFLAVKSLGLGFVLSSSGLGMMVGAGMLIRKKTQINYPRALAGAYFLIGLFLYFFVFSPNFIFTVLLLFAVGIGVAVLEITIDTVLQRVIPDDLKGKVFAAKGAMNNLFFLGALVAAGFLIKFVPVTALFGVMGCLGIVTAAVIYLSERQWAYLFLRKIFVVIFKLVFDFRVSGQERIPTTQRIILAANHTSLLDALALICAYPRRVYFLAAEFLFKEKFLGWVARMAGCIPVKRGGFNKDALKEALRILDAGHAIGIFPEGKISDDGQISEGKQGVALLAKLANAKIIPLAIEGAFEAWPKHQKLFKKFPIEVRFGEPLAAADYATPEEMTKEVMDEITQLKKDLEQEGYLRVDPGCIIKHLINLG